VLTRLSHGNIRIGTFQRQAFFKDTGAIARLTRYCLEHLYAETPVSDDVENAARLYDLVGHRTAELAAGYMAAGFVHGVLNSDNINVTGESFDYGPWRFTPYWDGDFTAAYFDHFGLYSFARQAEAINWDMAQLGGCLSLIAEGPALSDILSSWGDRFESALVAKLLWRLGVESRDGEADHLLARTLVDALDSKAATIDRVFFDWRGGQDPGEEKYPGEQFRKLARLLAGREREPVHGYWSDAEPCSMHIEEVEAIWEAIAEHDDWQPLEAKIADVRRMGAAMAEEPALT
jgi:uncharacterized protein YdiU (UPF0061 family)